MKTTKKPHGNGAAKKNDVMVKDAPTVAEATQVGGPVQIKTEDQQALRELDQTLLQMRLQLANLSVQAEILQSQRQQLVQKILDTDKSFYAQVEQTAAGLGLDLKTTKWNFDSARMTFTKA
jgi:enoyl reductase-like protein